MKRGISQEYSSPYKKAATRAKKWLSLSKQKQSNNNDNNIITGMEEIEE